MTSFFEFEDSIMLPLAIKSTAEALVSVWKVTDSAQRKKLSWFIEHKATFARLVEATRPSVVGDGCSVCGSKGRSTRKGIKSVCAACSQSTCKSCRVKRELCVFSPDGQLLKHNTRFCLDCLTVANRLDAAVVARDQALGREEAGSNRSSELTAANREAMGLSSGLGEPSIRFFGSANSSSNGTMWLSSGSSASSQSK